MAKINWNENKNTNTTEANTNLDSILKRLEELEKVKSNYDKLKKDFAKLTETTEKKDPRNQHKWPWAYSYKTWDGVPILDYKSKKIDTTKDLHYKAPNWQYVSNHLLVLSLADWETVEIEITEFNKAHWRSEKIIVKGSDLIRDEDTDDVVWYRFKDDTHWEFIVTKKAIN